MNSRLSTLFFKGCGERGEESAGLRDENPLCEPEGWRAVATERLRVPFWTVDADVIVPAAVLKAEV